MALEMRLPCSLLDGKPNSSTPGWVGMLIMDTTSPSGDVYKCTAVNNNGTVWSIVSTSDTPGGGGSGGGAGNYALPPLKLYAFQQSSGWYRQKTSEGGATRTYTAAEIHELASQCTVTLETRTSVATDAKRGHFTYVSSDVAEDGTVNTVLFSGYSEDYLSDPHLAEATLYPDGGIILNTRKWSPTSIDVDPTLTKSGVPADAKTVGGRLAALSGGGGAITPGIENKGKLLYVDDSGNVAYLQLGTGLEIINGRLCIIGTVTPDEPVEPDSEYTYLLDSTNRYLKTADDLYIVYENI